MLIAIATLTAVAVGLLAVGLRGRRTDDHPVCRRCGYDLTGGPADRCPECGGDLSRRRAVRVGHRRRRPTLIAAALALSGVGVATHGWPAVERRPSWLLVWQTHLPGDAQRAALFTLSRRMAAATPTDAVVDGLVDRGLAVQAASRSDDRAWNGTWGSLIESARKAGRVDPARWATYLRQASLVHLRVRPTVRPGDPLPVVIEQETRTGDGQMLAWYDRPALRIDGRPVPSAGWPGTSSSLVPTWGGRPAGPPEPPIPPVDGRVTRGLSVGRHEVSATLRVAVLFTTRYMPFDHAPVMGPPPPTMVIDFTADVPVSAAFDVCDAGHEPPVTSVDPARRKMVVEGLRVSGICLRNDGSIQLNVNVDPFQAPPGGVFRVSVRPAGGADRVILPCLDCRLDAWCIPPSARCDPVWIGTATEADVTFWPDAEAARRMMDATPIWGEPVVIRAVPIVKEQAAPAE